MTRITVRVEGHYEVEESPFSRSYKWHPSAITLVCDCGEEMAVTDASADSTCRCGADHSAPIDDALINDIRARESQLRDVVTHPWNHDVTEQAAQHLRDEAAYPEDSPRRYDDVTTSGFVVVDEDEERWKKARARQRRPVPYE
jgi:hypothetical protein